MPTFAQRSWLDHAQAKESVDALARRGEVRRYAKGAVLIHEGAVGDTLFVVLQGRLRAYTSSGDNSREFTHGVYGAGEYVGEMGLDGGPRSASVRALEATTCALVTRQTLEQHLAAHPEFAFHLLAKVIRRARAATLSAKQMALNDVYGRLRMQLEDSAQLQPDGTGLVSSRLTHRAMADMLGCSREMVSRLLKDLYAGGYLVDEKDALRVLKALPPRW